MEREEIPNPDNPEHAVRHRIKVKQGNRDLYGMDFLWIDEDQIKSRELPGDAVQVERMEWGHFYGYVKEVKDGGKPVASGVDAFAKVQALLPEAERIREEDPEPGARLGRRDQLLPEPGALEARRSCTWTGRTRVRKWTY